MELQPDTHDAAMARLASLQLEIDTFDEQHDEPPMHRAKTPDQQGDDPDLATPPIPEQHRKNKKKRRRKKKKKKRKRSNSQDTTDPDPDATPKKGLSKIFGDLLLSPTETDIADDNAFKKQCEDTQLPYIQMTTKEEVLSWIMYDWSYSPMWQITLVLIFPTYLADLATRYGCINNVPYGCDYENIAINTNEEVTVTMGSGNGGITLKPESYASFMISISSILQAFAYITIGGLADYESYQHYLFRICAVIAAGFNLIWIFFSGADSWLIAGWWGSIGVIFFGLSLISYNSYLHSIVSNHWLVRRAVRKGVDKEKITKIEQSLTDQISQFGYACGYCGSLFATIIAIGVIFMIQDVTLEVSDYYGVGRSVNDEVVVSEEKYDELWAKYVFECDMYFGNFSDDSNNNDYYLSGIKVKYIYDDLSIVAGDVFGRDDDNNNYNNASFVSVSSADAATIHYRYRINETVTSQETGETNKIDDYDFISGIQLWYDTIDSVSVISSIQFTHKSGIVSPIFGNNDSVSISTLDSDTITSANGDKWVFAGYGVYNELIQDDSIGDDTYSLVTGFKFLFMDSTDGQYGSTLSYRLALVLVGVWWLLFQLIPFKYLQNRTKSDIPSDANIFTISTKEFIKTWHKARQYPHMFRYLMSFFMFSDGVGTIAMVGVLFGQNELNMNNFELILLILESEIAAAAGGIFFVWFQKYLNWNAKKMLMMHLICHSFLPLFSLLGFLENSSIGLKNKWEMFVFVAWFAFHLGSLLSYSRGIMSYLIPIGYDNQMFALYEITDKGSSWIGPMMVAIISNTYSMRWAIFYVLLFFILPLPLIYFGVDLKQGMKDAGKYRSEKVKNDINLAQMSITTMDNKTKSQTTQSHTQSRSQSQSMRSSDLTGDDEYETESGQTEEEEEEDNGTNDQSTVQDKMNGKKEKEKEKQKATNSDNGQYAD